MMTYNWTKNEKDLKSWNTFLKKNKRGHYLQSSYWLNSFSSYGFNYELLLVKNTQEDIICGVGIVHGGLPFFKVCIVPCGPIISEGYEHNLEEMLQKILDKAKSLNSFYCHVNLPLFKSKQKNSFYTMSKLSNDSIFFSGNPGIIIRQISSINGFRSVNLDFESNKDSKIEIFKNFNSNTKRNIKKALQNGLVLKYARSEKDIKNAYDIILKNGKSQGYAVRAWEDVKHMLLKMVEDNMCIVPMCYQDNTIKGSLILFDIGQRLTYISGGTVREKIDLKIGHFLHYNMILYSLNKGYKFYDISVGGSESVTRFKNGFGAEHRKFIDARHWVFNKFKFKVYLMCKGFISKNKVLVSKILKILPKNV